MEEAEGAGDALRPPSPPPSRRPAAAAPFPPGPRPAWPRSRRRARRSRGRRRKPLRGAGAVAAAALLLQAFSPAPVSPATTAKEAGEAVAKKSLPRSTPRTSVFFCSLSIVGIVRRMDSDANRGRGEERGASAHLRRERAADRIGTLDAFFRRCTSTPSPQPLPITTETSLARKINSLSPLNPYLDSAEARLKGDSCRRKRKEK